MNPTIVLVHGAFADGAQDEGERLGEASSSSKDSILNPALIQYNGDKAAGADIVRSMAQRAGADIAEVEGSHVIMISQPQAVTDHILKAARAVSRS
jgi:hypothetical protein